MTGQVLLICAFIFALLGTLGDSARVLGLGVVFIVLYLMRGLLW